VEIVAAFSGDGRERSARHGLAVGRRWTRSASRLQPAPREIAIDPLDAAQVSGAAPCTGCSCSRSPGVDRLPHRDRSRGQEACRTLACAPARDDAALIERA
jgi:hypothetical protein